MEFIQSGYNVMGLTCLSVNDLVLSSDGSKRVSRSMNGYVYGSTVIGEPGLISFKLIDKSTIPAP